ncbi:LOW QUALITY PROTEIN: poly [ADP-ribose] polymerase tankyrase-2 [Drosophila albomicans]|uniref:LOW QUALITY PROTEIN: poly [ADP-ribose] polymerase tankyrase-2 n=1 Tax=Drosophila albomicans TaxID=7291 RepID=A0A6P8WDQ9_DROAB|nr:LOW QUALITY PROTEIN: poly [ADP-ribose] polymerase tankyrase-2 [Drosophila albomicans]
MLSYDLNERLLSAVHSGDFGQALNCIIEGAQATYVSSTCGRTAVGTAALLGDAELLELLVQSCEEPQLNLFQPSHTDTLEMESTPDGMEKLEWVDEFESEENDSENSNGGGEDSQLYHYYAKTFENTGEFLTQCCPNCRQQDPHLYDSDLATPLHYAAAWGHTECVAVLLKHQAPINVVNSEGYSPLHVGAGFAEVTRLLIKHGALVNAKTLSDGKTALHLAIENRCSAAAQLLLQTNININETDDEGETPLMMSIICNLQELAVELIKRGARINLQDKRGSTALYFAAIGRHLQLAQLLLERGARRLPSHHLLHHCVGPTQRGSAMIKLLLEHGDSLSLRDDDNCTPIMLAIHRQLPKLLAYMLEEADKQRSLGLYTEAQDEGLLLFAVQQIDDITQFSSILRVLLAKLPSARRDLYSCKAPATLVCGFVYSETPLARAISLHKLDMAQLLLREGCHLSQICAEQVINELSSLGTPQASVLAQLLANAGLKFPQSVTNYRQLSSEPRSLQSLSRQVIRQQLLLPLQQQQSSLHQLCPPTEQSSTLARIVEEKLCMPATLKRYVSEYSEVPTIRSRQLPLNPLLRSIESWD